MDFKYWSYHAHRPELKDIFIMVYEKDLWIGYKMKRKDCVEVKALLQKAVGEYFAILDNDYFIICEDFNNNYKNVIVHGHGTDEKPYEVIIPRLNEGNPITKRFTDREEFMEYIENDLKREMVLYKI